MKNFAIGLSLAALMLGGGAYAAQGAGKQHADADGNGVVTRAEAQAAASAAFTRHDQNKDGKLDRTDRQARMEARKTERFTRLDADKDGQISRTEFMADSGPAHGKRMAMGAPSKGGPDGMRHHRRHGGGRGLMGPGKMGDANKDGAMTQAEFASAALQRFDALDANKDGQVTGEERRAARERMKAERQQMRAQKAQG